MTACWCLIASRSCERRCEDTIRSGTSSCSSCNALRFSSSSPLMMICLGGVAPLLRQDMKQELFARPRAEEQLLTEQVAFAPSHLVPGIEPSMDKMLQGRLLNYPDTHRHRLGKNYEQIPINCPYRARMGNYNHRDGTMLVDGGKD